MSDWAKTLLADENTARTYPEHDCFAWNVQVYCSGPDCLYSQCRMCNRITGFMWRKWRWRIRSLFTSEPLFKTFVAYRAAKAVASEGKAR